MKKVYYIPFLAILLGACSSEVPEVIDDDNGEEIVTPIEKERVFKEREDIVLSEKEKAMSSLQNDFSFKLYKEYESSLGKNGMQKNFILSPLSVHQCMSMLANGLGDESVSDIVKVLLPESCNIGELNAYNKHLIDALSDVDNLSDITIANSLWTNTGYNVGKDFANAVREAYYAETGSADLFSDEGRLKVNGWINEKTGGLIPELFITPPMVSAMLANALYFKATWSEKFKVTDGVFRNANGKRAETDFITHTTYYKLYKSDSFKVLSISYGNWAFRMNIILPEQNIPQESFELTSTEWERASSCLKLSRVEACLPKFKVEENANIIEILKNMGLHKMFSGKNLSKISSDFMGFNAVLHSAVLKVDENGSEGGAATATGWVTSSGEGTTPSEPELFKADRPFMFILDEVSTGTILFMGKINNL